MASFLTNRYASDVQKGVHNVPTQDNMLMLVQSTATPDRDEEFMGDVTGDECDATGYASTYDSFATRLLWQNPTVVADDANDRAVLDADNMVDANAWQTLGGATNNTLSGIWVAKKDTNDAASPLIGFVEFSSTRTTDGADFPVVFNSDGIFFLSTNP